MTTRRNSRQGFGSIQSDERRTPVRRSDLPSHGRYEHEYESDFRNSRNDYDEDADERYITNERNRYNRYENDDEDYDNERYVPAGRSYESGYDEDFEDVSDEYNEGQYGNERTDYKSERQNYYNRPAERNEYSRRGFGSMGRQNQFDYERTGQGYSSGGYYNDGISGKYNDERRVNRGYAEEPYNTNAGQRRNYNNNWNEDNSRWSDGRRGTGYGDAHGRRRNPQNIRRTSSTSPLSKQNRSRR